MWLDTFNEMRKKSGMSLDEISEKSGVPKGTLAKITSGITKAPALETMKSLVYAMGYTLKDLDDGLEESDGFSAEEKAHIKKYRLLDPYGKEAVDGVLDVESRRCEEERQKQTAILREQWEQMDAAEEIAPEDIYSIPLYSLPMSAGTGQEAGQEYPEDFLLKKRPPRGTSFIARVSGNSMEPTYHHDELVFVHAQNEIPVGKIGIFFMDGQQWIKELGYGELISHNPEYAPRIMADDILCQGLVLGICDNSYLQ